MRSEVITDLASRLDLSYKLNGTGTGGEWTRVQLGFRDLVVSINDLEIMAPQALYRPNPYLRRDAIFALATRYLLQ